MATYKTKINPFTGQLTIVPADGLLFFKDSVADFASLPPTGNTANDARITNDDGHLYVWSGSAWIDQGNIVDFDWSAILNGPTSTPAEIDTAVTNTHVVNSDIKLDDGQPNEVTAADLRSHLDSTSNPHSVDATQVGLGNVDNTSDIDKPISTATQDALDLKQDDLGFTPEDVANKSTDGTLATNSDTLYPTEQAVKTYADTKEPALGFTPEDVSNKSTDGTLASNSDTLYPTEQAVKTYADQLIASANAVVYKGVIDCSTNPDYPAADAGDLYVVSVAGKIGGASGVDVESGDILLCNTDGTVTGNQAAVGIYWNVIEKNDTGVVSGPASSTDDNLATFDGVTGKLLQDSGILSSDVSTAVTNSHVQNSDIKLDDGNANEVTAADLRSHLDSTSNPHSVTATQVGLGSVTDDAQLKAADLDIDGTLAANSDTKIPSQQAVKEYVDSFKFSAIQYIFDGGGVVITTGIQGDIEVPFNCTITKAILLADQTGSIVVDIWKDTYANYPATIADTIVAAAKPTISSAIKSSDGTLTGWTTTLTKGDILRLNVDSVTSIQKCTLILEVSKT